MVCTVSLSQCRMAAMVRLLGNGGYSEITAEEATHEKIAVQIINREFREADEANLLEEEDMHIFDSRPLTDPLHLVCCNTCKKPIKASQYAAHADRCSQLNSPEEIGMEPDGGIGHRKPPRKGRKKLQTSHENHGSLNGEQDKSESLNGDDVTVSESILDDRTVTISCMLKNSKYVPAPLATKIYHLRGTHRLRAALGQLYHDSVTKDTCSNSSSKFIQQNVVNQGETYPGYAAKNPDHILAQSSESCLGTSGGYTSAVNFPNQLQENNPISGLSTDAATMGTMRMRYHTSSHSFSGNSGATRGIMQQPNGSVPVV